MKLFNCQKNFWTQAAIINSSAKTVYLQLLDEPELLPSIQHSPIPPSTPLGLQEVDLKLLSRSIVLRLGNFSKPRGCSKLDIVQAAAVEGTVIEAQQYIMDSKKIPNNALLIHIYIYMSFP